MSTAPEGATHLLPPKEGVRSEPVYYRTPSVHGVARWDGSRWEPAACLPEAAVLIQPGPDYRLIEAAPDLLEALKALVKINVEHNQAIQRITGKPAGWKDSYLDAARAAIAKATGEQP